MKQYINGQLVDLTETEINEFNSIQALSPTPLTPFETRMEILREQRNNLLLETDYLGLSDQTMSAEMTTYRQALRDITNGLSTVADIEAVIFPEKPEV